MQASAMSNACSKAKACGSAAIVPHSRVDQRCTESLAAEARSQTASPDRKICASGKCQRYTDSDLLPVAAIFQPAHGTVILRGYRRLMAPIRAQGPTNMPILIVACT
jgi:hypothetical protein